jgi:hypothetical protein
VSAHFGWFRGIKVTLFVFSAERMGGEKNREQRVVRSDQGREVMHETNIEHIFLFVKGEFLKLGQRSVLELERAA